MDLKSALDALDAHEPGLLLELRETQWLDAKAEPYQLANPRAVEELAKDVGAFANGGGVSSSSASRPARSTTRKCSTTSWESSPRR